MNTIWKAKFFLEDIMEAQKINIKQLSNLTNIDIEWLESYLLNDEVYIDEVKDYSICEALNQVTGYFYKIDQEYLKLKNTKN